MKHVCAALLLCFTCTAHAQLSVSFDFSNLEQTIAFIRKGKAATQDDVKTMLNSNGVKTIIRKIRSNDSTARVALQNVSQGIRSTGPAANFQYDFIRANLERLDSFATFLKANQSVIIDSIRMLSGYLPEGKRAEVKVCFLAGGFSAGFTMGDGDVFYVGTHQYKSDFNAIVNTCQHELFHNIQSLLYNRSAVMDKLEKAKEEQSLYAYYLAQNLFVEGTAEYVADVEKLDPNTPYIKNEIEHGSVNRYRMRDNIYLIDRLITDAYNRTEKSNVDLAYSIMFDWNWNNPGYATGKMMARALVSAYGTEVIKRYLQGDPILFVRDYIRLTKERPEAFPYAFCEEFEKIIATVCEKVAALK